MLTILAGALVLGILMFVHELGHFASAKALGVRVLKFSLGFGPELIGFSLRGTRYLIAALPIGGFVKMAGESPDSPERTGAGWEFYSKPWWARMTIAVCGPAMNLFFAFLACAAMYVVGVRFLDFDSVVGRVEPSSVATKYGFADNDKVVEVDGVRIRSWSDFVEKVERPNAGSIVTIVVQRKIRTGEKVQLSIPVRRQDREKLFSGIAPVSSPPVVGTVNIGLPAYEGGLRAGDRIVSVDGIEVTTWERLAELIRKKPDKEVLLVVERGGKRFQRTLTPVRQDVKGLGAIGLIGISPTGTAYSTVRASGLRVAALAAENTAEMLVQTYAGLFKLALRPRQLGKSIAGPVTIIQMSGDQARRGLGNLLYFIAFVSIALVVVNLLPIPIMDGGHVIFCAIEGIRGKALSMSKQVAFQRIGIAIVGTLILFAFWVDFARIVQRGRATLGTPIEQKGGNPGERDTAGAVSSE
jgi:regulator of sigma E protease